MSYKSPIPANERTIMAKAIQEGDAPGAQAPSKIDSNRVRIQDVVFIVLLIANLVVEFI